MATPRTIRISLYPASIASTNPLIYETEMTIGGGEQYPRKEFDANTTAEIVGVAMRMAAEHGKPCQAVIAIVKGSKPRGYDDATKRLFYNMQDASAENEAAA